MLSRRPRLLCAYRKVRSQFLVSQISKQACAMAPQSRLLMAWAGEERSRIGWMSQATRRGEKWAVQQVRSTCPPIAKKKNAPWEVTSRGRFRGQRVAGALSKVKPMSWLAKVNLNKRQSDVVVVREARMSRAVAPLWRGRCERGRYRSARFAAVDRSLTMTNRQHELVF